MKIDFFSFLSFFLYTRKVYLRYGQIVTGILKKIMSCSNDNMFLLFFKTFSLQEYQQFDFEDIFYICCLI